MLFTSIKARRKIRTNTYLVEGTIEGIIPDMPEIKDHLLKAQRIMAPEGIMSSEGATPIRFLY